MFQPPTQSQSSESSSSASHSSGCRSSGPTNPSPSPASCSSISSSSSKAPPDKSHSRSSPAIFLYLCCRGCPDAFPPFWPPGPLGRLSFPGCPPAPSGLLLLCCTPSAAGVRPFTSMTSISFSRNASSPRWICSISFPLLPPFSSIHKTFYPFPAMNLLLPASSPFVCVFLNP